jgi:hypothetical protein
VWVQTDCRVPTTPVPGLDLEMDQLDSVFFSPNWASQRHAVETGRWASA